MPVAGSSELLGPALTTIDPNCSGVAEPAQRVDRQLERLAPGRGRLADLPGGRIDVLAADGAGHIHGGHAARRQLLRVEPGADAVVALAHVVDVRDAIDAQQLVLDEDRGEVAQVDVVVTTVRREEVDDHQACRAFSCGS